jgi:hypothetical protein
MIELVSELFERRRLGNDKVVELGMNEGNDSY